ncbi:hypothetical protein D3C72_869920 [compost metagenome]
MRLLPERRGSNQSRKPSSTLAWVTGLSLGAGMSPQAVLAARAPRLAGATAASGVRPGA